MPMTLDELTKFKTALRLMSSPGADRHGNEMVYKAHVIELLDLYLDPAEREQKPGPGAQPTKVIKKA